VYSFFFLLKIGSIVCILIPVQGGGSTYAWDSDIVIALFVVGFLLLIGFIFVEAKISPEPVIPGSVFMNQTVYAATGFSFFMG